MKNYTRIRGKAITERCINKTTWGSPLYCDCGCQVPRETDPDINLDGVTVSRKSDKGYAEYILSRNGQECGMIDVQYSYLVLDGYEFLGVDRQYLAGLLDEALSIQTSGKTSPAGDALTDTAAAVAATEAMELAEQDAANANHPGYCTKCHSYCYGDCEANQEEVRK